MNPVVKYTLARIGLFVVAFLALWPLNLNVFLKLMIAVLVSAGASWWLLRGLRDEVAGQVAGGVARRQAEKERLRSALAGDDDQPPPTAGSEGDDGPADRR